MVEAIQPSTSGQTNKAHFSSTTVALDLSLITARIYTTQASFLENMICKWFVGWGIYSLWQHNTLFIMIDFTLGYIP